MPKHTEPNIDAAMTYSGFSHTSGSVCIVVTELIAPTAAPAPIDKAPKALMNLPLNAPRWSLVIIIISSNGFILAFSQNWFNEHVVYAVYTNECVECNNKQVHVHLVASRRLIGKPAHKH